MYKIISIILFMLFITSIPAFASSEKPAVLDFEIDKCYTTMGQTCYVVGSFSNWGLEGAVPLITSPDRYPKWTGSISLTEGSEAYFKFVVVSNNKIIRWEAGKDRYISAVYPGHYSATFGSSAPTPAYLKYATNYINTNVIYTNADWNRVVLRYVKAGKLIDSEMKRVSGDKWLASINASNTKAHFHNGMGYIDNKGGMGYDVGSLGDYVVESGAVRPRDYQLRIIGSGYNQLWLSSAGSFVPFSKQSEREWRLNIANPMSGTVISSSGCELRSGKLLQAVDGSPCKTTVVSSSSFDYLQSNKNQLLNLPGGTWVKELSPISPVLHGVATSKPGTMVISPSEEVVATIVGTIEPRHLSIRNPDFTRINFIDHGNHKYGTYYYKVRLRAGVRYAMDFQSTAVAHNFRVVDWNIVKDFSPPAAPSDPQIVSKPSQNLDIYHIRWQSLDKDVFEYRVYYKPNASPAIDTLLATLPVGSRETEITLPKIDFLTALDVRVSAIDSSGNESRRVPASFGGHFAYICSSIDSFNAMDIKYYIDPSTTQDYVKTFESAVAQYNSLGFVKFSRTYDSALANAIFKTEFSDYRGYNRNSCSSDISEVVLSSKFSADVLVGTAVHEIGHLLGLEHQPVASSLDSPKTKSIMAYARDFDTLQPFDVDLLKKKLVGAVDTSIIRSNILPNTISFDLAKQLNSEILKSSSVDLKDHRGRPVYYKYRYVSNGSLIFVLDKSSVLAPGMNLKFRYVTY